MKIDKITAILDEVLEPEKFDDVSNNGVQIARSGSDVKCVAFAVDASLASVEAAVEAGAGLLVVHHGISWGGGIKRLSGGVYEVVKAAVKGDLAVYAAHLPLDANRKVGNNFELARALSLTALKPAFSYHGNVIGVVGRSRDGRKIGVCSGGAGCFAEEAKSLGCDLFLTGEADWGEKIAAENAAVDMVCAGHYETEVYGVKALMKLLSKTAPGLKTVFVGRETEGVKLP
jgi:putative NIF3 family GTP cyclohydrolase 1 type 2